MSIMICQTCERYVDTDYDVEGAPLTKGLVCSQCLEYCPPPTAYEIELMDAVREFTHMLAAYDAGVPVQSRIKYAQQELIRIIGNIASEHDGQVIFSWE